jgi:hypothetical protein
MQHTQRLELWEEVAAIDHAIGRGATIKRYNL